MRRRSQSLAGVTGAGARGDVQYRLTRRTTVGALYQFNHYVFTRSLGGTDIHGVAGSYAVQFSRFLELSGYAGVMRVESKAFQSSVIDPVIAALLGIGGGANHTYDRLYSERQRSPFRTFHRGVAYASVGHTVTPGNGLFLTSVSTAINGGYTYTGLRRWSLAGQVSRVSSNTDFNVNGAYGTTAGSVTASHQIASWPVHVVAEYALHRYDSSDFQKYNRIVHEGRIGIGFSPGDIPLRIW